MKPDLVATTVRTARVIAILSLGNVDQLAMLLPGSVAVMIAATTTIVMEALHRLGPAVEAEEVIIIVATTKAEDTEVLLVAEVLLGSVTTHLHLLLAASMATVAFLVDTETQMLGTAVNKEWVLLLGSALLLVSEVLHQALALSSKTTVPMEGLPLLLHLLTTSLHL